MIMGMTCYFFVCVCVHTIRIVFFAVGTTPAPSHNKVTEINGMVSILLNLF